MNEVKKNFSKWMYWFLLAVAIILVYKFLDNFTAIGNAIGKFVGIISPFLAGTLMAYLLYIPASRIEKKLLKSKKKFFKKRARGLSVFITFTFTILLIILLVNVILPVVTESIVELVNNFQNYWNTTISKLNELPEDSFFKSEKVIETIKEIGDNIKKINPTNIRIPFPLLSLSLSFNPPQKRVLENKSESITINPTITETTQLKRMS